jgi:UPF0042 nucleotide-binding protein
MGEPAPVLEAVEGETHVPDVVVITGMSGAGRTEAMHTFEDLGYYVIDNLPPSMLLSLANMVGINSGIGRHLAVVCDLRSQGLFDELLQEIDKLAEHEISCALLFLDASDEVLRRRYTLTRRRNPIAQEGEATIDAVRRERHALEEVRHRADVVIDTSNLRTIELRRRLETIFSELTAQQMLEVHVFSFGFKYGMPVEADLLIDVRFLPNPYWDPAMRTLTGMDDPVMSFVLGRPETQGFLQAWYALLDSVMPGYVAEGKSTLSIGVGCSGGQHRSVVLARATAQYLRDAGYHVTEDHRDLPRAANVTPLTGASAAIPADASGYTPPAVRGAEALGASQETSRG